MINILIVDDSKLNIKIAQNIIEDNIKDVSIETAVDPEIAQDMLKNQAYHIIILDIIMPKMTGIEVLTWIKTQDHLEHSKVIMFTSLSDGDSLSQAFALGAYDYIRKPFEEYEFIARIKHAIQEYQYAVLIEENIITMTEKTAALKAANDTLKKTQTDLIQSQRIAGIGNLASGIAHELNNPLSFVQSNFYVLKGGITELFNLYDTVKRTFFSDTSHNLKSFEETVNYKYLKEELPEIYTDISNGISRMKDIINALRNFSNIDAMEEKEAMPLSDVFDNIQTLAKESHEKKIDLTFNTEEDLMVYGNRTDIGLSFYNLIQNSIEAIEGSDKAAKGVIQVHGKRHDEKIYITIVDNGKGMDPSTLNNALNPFFTTKDVGDGRGLGLTIAYNCFVYGMGGTFKIESIAHGGTSISIVIPCQA